MSILNDQIKVDALALNKVLDFLPYPFLVSEMRNGVYSNLYVNRRFIEEIGYTIKDIPTIHHWFMKAYPDRNYRTEVVTEWRERMDQAKLNDEDSVMMNALIQTREKGQQWYKVKSSVYDQINLVAFINIHDVILKENELERLNENKNRTLSILSHDLRGPLVNLHALTRMALKSYLTPEQFVSTVRDVNEKTFQVLEFVETTLLWTKSNFDNVKVELVNVRIKDVIKSILDLYGGSISAKHIQINTEVSEDVEVFTDNEILTIVVRNLLSNAIKFTPDTGSISISYACHDNHHIIGVKDSGIGMTKEIQETIMVDNYSSRKGTRQEKGLGIGLRLCRELLKKVNGWLEIDSESGKGTLVRIILPVANKL